MREKIVESIFRNPPINSTELAIRLEPYDKDHCRMELCFLLAKDHFHPSDYGLFCEIVSVLGLSNFFDDLIELVLNKELSLNLRRFAMTAVVSTDPERAAHALAMIPPEEVHELGELPLLQLMEDIQKDHSVASELTGLLVDADDEIRLFMLHQLGKCRREVGTSAMLAYQDALACDKLADCHEQMLKAVVEEADIRAIDFLTDLLSHKENAPSEKLYKTALFRLRTSAIDPQTKKQKIEGHAYLGTCDGESVFGLIARIRMAKDLWSTSNVVIRAAGEIRDGFVIPSQNKKDFETLLEQVKGDGASVLVKISLAQAAKIVNEALLRTKEMKVKLDGETIAAIDVYRNVEPEEISLVDPLPLDTEQLRRELEPILKSAAFDYWFLDQGDLTAIGLSEDYTIETEADIVSFGKQIEKTPIKKRLHSMALHCVRWFSANNEPVPAGLFAAAAKELETDFVNSALFTLVARRSFVEDDGHGPVGKAIGFYGDPQLRDSLKREFFSNLKHPKSTHLAKLDLTEVAYTIIERMVEFFPAEERPRHSLYEKIAFELGKSYANLLFDKNVDKFGTTSLTKRLDRLSKAVARVGDLPLLTAEAIAKGALDPVLGFVRDVCPHCMFSCFNSPNAKMDDAFFSRQHPVQMSEEYYIKEEAASLESPVPETEPVDVSEFDNVIPYVPKKP